MERLTFGIGAASLIVLGICMVIWPVWIAEMNRDPGNTRPPSTSQIRQMRILGIVLAVMGAYALYAIVTGMPGAEFFPA